MPKESRPLESEKLWTAKWREIWFGTRQLLFLYIQGFRNMEACILLRTL
jgi:hypothetical protein